MQPPFVTALTTDAFELGLAVVVEGVAAWPAPRRGGHGRARDDCSDCVTGLVKGRRGRQADGAAGLPPAPEIVGAFRHLRFVPAAAIPWPHLSVFDPRGAPWPPSSASQSRQIGVQLTVFVMVSFL
jgi:hypothetical protein